MNDPEVTMSNALMITNLIAHEKALDAAGVAITLAMRVSAPLRSIADQVIRSASSVPAKSSLRLTRPSIRTSLPSIWPANPSMRKPSTRWPVSGWRGA